MLTDSKTLDILCFERSPSAVMETLAKKHLIDRINSDLGNDLGNLLNRLIGMSGKYFDGKIDSKDIALYYKDELAQVEESIDKLEPLLFEMQIHRYLEELWRPLSIANKAIDKHQPWVLMKEGKTDEAMALVALIANILARVSVMLHPVMPETTRKIATALGFEIDNSSWTQLIIEKSMLASFMITQIPPLFPRIEEVKLEQAEETPKEEKKEASSKEEGIALIGIDDFFKTSIKIGTIIEAQEIEKSDRLLLLKVDIGEASPRQVVAGIKRVLLPSRSAKYTDMPCSQSKNRQNLWATKARV